MCLDLVVVFLVVDQVKWQVSLVMAVRFRMANPKPLVVVMLSGGGLLGCRIVGVVQQVVCLRVVVCVEFGRAQVWIWMWW